MFHPKRACLKTYTAVKSLEFRVFVTYTEHRFFWLCRFLFVLQFHMQSMHQPHPCYLLKQSFWNPIWGQCRLNKISFWFGLPLWIGLLCLSRQNQQARKVCPVLHGWWCVLRLTIRPSCSARAPRLLHSAFSFPFHSSFSSPSICSRAACRLPAGQSRGKPTPIVYFGICLIACVAVCIFFLPLSLLVVAFFFFSILVFVLFCFPCPRLLSLYLKVLNTKMLT